MLSFLRCTIYNNVFYVFSNTYNAWGSLGWVRSPWGSACRSRERAQARRVAWYRASGARGGPRRVTLPRIEAANPPAQTVYMPQKRGATALEPTVLPLPPAGLFGQRPPAGLGGLSNPMCKHAFLGWKMRKDLEAGLALGSDMPNADTRETEANLNLSRPKHKD